MLEAKFKNDPSAKYTFYDTADQKKKSRLPKSYVLFTHSNFY